MASSRSAVVPLLAPECLLLNVQCIYGGNFTEERRIFKFRTHFCPGCWCCSCPRNQLVQDALAAVLSREEHLAAQPQPPGCTRTFAHLDFSRTITSHSLEQHNLT